LELGREGPTLIAEGKGEEEEEGEEEEGERGHGEGRRKRQFFVLVSFWGFSTNQKEKEKKERRERCQRTLPAQRFSNTPQPPLTPHPGHRSQAKESDSMKSPTA